ncbi:cupin domain-containing protein [Kitasatospora sp. NPDC059646]|uniref:cupin domain-containing protein n=1 Tax=Kitasatospora sp. NPDC059646 TaxID=3346893 RepID=UPI0036AA16F1
MTPIDLAETADALPQAWSSLPLGLPGPAALKVLRMDGRPLPPERHDAPEALLVLDGVLRLVAGGVPVEVRAGQLFVVGAGVEHSVAPGSLGTLVLFEAAAAG